MFAPTAKMPEATREKEDIKKFLRESVVEERGVSYAVSAADFLPGIYSEARIRNGAVTIIEGTELSDTVQLLSGLVSAQRLGEVSGRWYGQRVKADEVVRYLSKE